MAGMRGLGRTHEPLLNPSGIDICLKDCSGIGFVAVNGSAVAAILTVIAKPSFGGTPANWTTALGFGQPNTGYTRLAGLTAHLIPQSLTSAWSSNVLTSPITTNLSMFYVEFLVSQLADTYDYINVTVSGSGATLPMAIPFDLTVQRTPANLRIPAA